MMNYKIKILLIVAILFITVKSGFPQIRIVISSDFPPLDVCLSGCADARVSDPDDIQSMVRFLFYANEFDIEGLIATSATFTNLKFKSPKRQTKILVTTRKKKDHVIISVKDNGVGIDKSKFAAKFSKYYRLENAIEGSGLADSNLKRVGYL